MEFPSLKRKKVESSESEPNTKGVPQTLITTNPVFLSRESHKFVAFHCNTIYTGSIIRVWKPFSFAEQDRIAYVFWKCTNGLFVHFEDKDDDNFGAQNDDMDSIHSDDTNVDEDLVLDSNNVFNKFLERDSDVCNEKGNPLRNPYSYLKMSFSEMTEVMTGNVTIEELNDIKAYLNSVTDAIMSRENQKKRNVWNPDQRFFSQNPLMYTSIIST